MPISFTLNSRQERRVFWQVLGVPDLGAEPTSTQVFEFTQRCGQAQLAHDEVARAVAVKAYRYLQALEPTSAQVVTGGIVGRDLDDLFRDSSYGLSPTFRSEPVEKSPLAAQPRTAPHNKAEFDAFPDDHPAVFYIRSQDILTKYVLITNEDQSSLTLTSLGVDDRQLVFLAANLFESTAARFLIQKMDEAARSGEPCKKILDLSPYIRAYNSGRQLSDDEMSYLTLINSTMYKPLINRSIERGMKRRGGVKEGAREFTPFGVELLPDLTPDEILMKHGLSDDERERLLTAGVRQSERGMNLDPTDAMVFMERLSTSAFRAGVPLRVMAFGDGDQREYYHLFRFGDQGTLVLVHGLPEMDGLKVRAPWERLQIRLLTAEQGKKLRPLFNQSFTKEHQLRLLKEVKTYPIHTLPGSDAPYFVQPDAGPALIAGDVVKGAVNMALLREEARQMFQFPGVNRDAETRTIKDRYIRTLSSSPDLQRKTVTLGNGNQSVQVTLLLTGDSRVHWSDFVLIFVQGDTLKFIHAATFQHTDAGKSIDWRKIAEFFEERLKGNPIKAGAKLEVELLQLFYGPAAVLNDNGIGTIPNASNDRGVVTLGETGIHVKIAKLGSKPDLYLYPMVPLVPEVEPNTPKMSGPSPVAVFEKMLDDAPGVFSMTDPNGQVIRSVLFTAPSNDLGITYLLLMRGDEHKLFALTPELSVLIERVTEFSFEDVLRQITDHLASHKKIPLSDSFQHALSRLWEANGDVFDANGFAEVRSDSSTVAMQLRGQNLEVILSNGREKYGMLLVPFLSGKDELSHDKQNIVYLSPVTDVPEALTHMVLYEDIQRRGYGLALHMVEGRVARVTAYRSSQPIRSLEDLLIHGADDIELSPSILLDRHFAVPGTEDGSVIGAVVANRDASGLPDFLMAGFRRNFRSGDDTRDYSMRHFLEKRFGDEQYGEIQHEIFEGGRDGDLFRYEAVVGQEKWLITFSLGKDGKPDPKSLIIRGAEDESGAPAEYAGVSLYSGSSDQFVLTARAGGCRFLIGWTKNEAERKGGSFEPPVLMRKITNLSALHKTELRQAVFEVNGSVPPILSTIELTSDEGWLRSSSPAAVSLEIKGIKNSELKDVIRKRQERTLTLRWGITGTPVSYTLSYEGDKVFLVPGPDAPKGRMEFVRRGDQKLLLPQQDGELDMWVKSALTRSDLHVGYDQDAGQLRFDGRKDSDGSLLRAIQSLWKGLGAPDDVAVTDGSWTFVLALTDDKMVPARLLLERTSQAVLAVPATGKPLVWTVKREAQDMLTIPAGNLILQVRKTTRLDGSVSYDLLPLSAERVLVNDKPVDSWPCRVAPQDRITVFTATAAGWERTDVTFDDQMGATASVQAISRASVTNSVQIPSILVFPDGTQKDDPLQTTLHILTHPITGAQELVSAQVGDMILPISQKGELTLILPVVGNISIHLQKNNDGSYKAVRNSPEVIWEVLKGANGLSLVGMTDTGAELSFPLLAANGRWFLDPQFDAQVFGDFMAWHGVMGWEAHFNADEHNAIEVLLTPKGAFHSYQGLRRLGGLEAVTTIPLDEQGLSEFRRALESSLLRGAPSLDEVVVEQQPVQISESEFLRFLPGEALTPNARTIQMIKEAYKTQENGTVLGFEEGKVYYYELQAEHTPVTLRLPVRFRPDRPSNPFEIDQNLPVEAYVTGDPSQAKRITDDRLQVYDDGGRWCIYLIEAGLQDERIREFRLSAVVSPESPVVIGMVNVFNRNGSSKDKTELRRDALDAITQSVVRQLGHSISDLPKVRFVRPRVSVSRGRDVTWRFASIHDDGATWAELSGMGLHADSKSLDLKKSLHLTVGTGSNGSAQVLESISLRAIATEQPGTYTLAEMITDPDTNLERIGRKFTWNIGLGTITLNEEKIPVDPTQADSLLREHGFPKFEAQRAAAFNTIRREPRQSKVYVDKQISKLSPARRSFVAPERILANPDSRLLDDLLQGLHARVFLPVESSLFAQILNGRDEEVLVFQAPDGSLLVLPVIASPDNPDRYTVAAEEDKELPGVHLLVPDPAQPGAFLETPLRCDVKKTSGGLSLHLVIGSSQLVFDFDLVSTRNPVNGRMAFGFGAALHKTKGLSAAVITKYLQEWITYARVGVPIGEVLPDHSGVRLPDGRVVGFGVRRTDDGIFIPQGIHKERDESGKVTGCSITISRDDGTTETWPLERDPDGASLFYTIDPAGQVYTLAISDSGQPLLWARPLGLDRFLRAAESTPFDMVGLKGERYKSARSSPTMRRLVSQTPAETVYELGADFGREVGAGGRALVTDFDDIDLIKSSRIKIRIKLAADGTVSVEPDGLIKTEGQHQPWQDAKIELYEYGKGRFRIYIKSKTPREGNYHDYAWLDFDSKDAFVGGDARFAVALAHYNRTNYSSNTLPTEASFGAHKGFLNMLYSALQVDADLAAHFDESLDDSCLHPATREALLGMQGVLAEQALVQGALQTFGMRETDANWDQAFTTLLHVVRRRQEQNDDVPPPPLNPSSQGTAGPVHTAGNGSSPITVTPAGAPSVVSAAQPGPHAITNCVPSASQVLSHGAHTLMTHGALALQPQVHAQSLAVHPMSHVSARPALRQIPGGLHGLPAAPRSLASRARVQVVSRLAKK